MFILALWNSWRCQAAACWTWARDVNLAEAQWLVRWYCKWLYAAILKIRCHMMPYVAILRFVLAATTSKARGTAEPWASSCRASATLLERNGQHNDSGWWKSCMDVRIRQGMSRVNIFCMLPCNPCNVLHLSPPVTSLINMLGPAFFLVKICPHLGHLGCKQGQFAFQISRMVGTNKGQGYNDCDNNLHPGSRNLRFKIRENHKGSIELLTKRKAVGQDWSQRPLAILNHDLPSCCKRAASFWASRRHSMHNAQKVQTLRLMSACKQKYIRTIIEIY